MAPHNKDKGKGVAVEVDEHGNSFLTTGASTHADEHHVGNAADRDGNEYADEDEYCDSDESLDDDRHFAYTPPLLASSSRVKGDRDECAPISLESSVQDEDIYERDVTEEGNEIDNAGDPSAQQAVESMTEIFGLIVRQERLDQFLDKIEKRISGYSPEADAYRPLLEAHQWDVNASVVAYIAAQHMVPAPVDQASVVDDHVSTALLFEPDTVSDTASIISDLSSIDMEVLQSDPFAGANDRGLTDSQIRAPIKMSLSKENELLDAFKVLAGHRVTSRADLRTYLKAFDWNLMRAWVEWRTDRRVAMRLRATVSAWPEQTLSSGYDQANEVVATNGIEDGTTSDDGESPLMLQVKRVMKTEEASATPMMDIPEYPSDPGHASISMTEEHNSMTVESVREHVTLSGPREHSLASATTARFYFPSRYSGLNDAIEEHVPAAALIGQGHAASVEPRGHSQASATTIGDHHFRRRSAPAMTTDEHISAAARRVRDDVLPASREHSPASATTVQVYFSPRDSAVPVKGGEQNQPTHNNNVGDNLVVQEVDHSATEDTSEGGAIMDQRPSLVTSLVPFNDNVEQERRDAVVVFAHKLQEIHQVTISKSEAIFEMHRADWDISVALEDFAGTERFRRYLSEEFDHMRTSEPEREEKSRRLAVLLNMTHRPDVYSVLEHLEEYEWDVIDAAVAWFDVGIAISESQDAQMNAWRRKDHDRRPLPMPSQESIEPAARRRAFQWEEDSDEFVAGGMARTPHRPAGVKSTPNREHGWVLGYAARTAHAGVPAAHIFNLEYISKAKLRQNTYHHINFKWLPDAVYGENTGFLALPLFDWSDESHLIHLRHWRKQNILRISQVLARPGSQPFTSEMNDFIYELSDQYAECLARAKGVAKEDVIPFLAVSMKVRENWRDQFNAKFVGTVPPGFDRPVEPRTTAAVAVQRTRIPRLVEDFGVSVDKWTSDRNRKRAARDAAARSPEKRSRGGSGGGGNDDDDNNNDQ